MCVYNCASILMRVSALKKYGRLPFRLSHTSKAGVLAARI